jgi:hypothetical protein
MKLFSNIIISRLDNYQNVWVNNTLINIVIFDVLLIDLIYFID